MSGSVSMVDGHIDEVLKPCPFCGGEAKYVELYSNTKTGESSGYVRCSKIIPCAEQPNVRSKGYVYKKWNRRADT